MSSLSIKIINYLLAMTNKTCSDEDFEVYKYGMECLLNRFFSDVILLIWSLLTETVLETFCWLVVFCIYRNHAGGFHASTNERCIISTSILGMSNFIAIKYQALINHYISCIALFILITCILCAPIKSTKKILPPKERKVQKCISLVIVLCDFIIAKLVGGDISITIVYSMLSASVLMVITSLPVSIESAHLA